MWSWGQIEGFWISLNHLVLLEIQVEKGRLVRCRMKEVDEIVVTMRANIMVEK